MTTDARWQFDDLKTFDGFSAEGHIGDNFLFDVMKQGDSAFQKGDYASAQALYRHLVSAAPTNGWMHYRLAHVEQKLRNFDQALSSYWAAFRRELPSGMGEDYGPVALCDVGAVYAEMSDIEGAIAAFRLSLRLRFSHPAAYGLGQALYLAGEPVVALADLKVCAEYKPYKQNASRLIELIHADTNLCHSL